MLVKEVSVFIQDESGRLSDICNLLGENSINIRGFAISDTAEGFGIFRLLTNDTDKTVEVLKAAGFTASISDILTVRVPDEAGGLGRVLNIFSSNELNIEYLYATAGTLIAFKLDKNERAIKALKSAGVEVVSRADFLSM
jgi:hypothetical protein